MCVHHPDPPPATMPSATTIFAGQAPVSIPEACELEDLYEPGGRPAPRSISPRAERIRYTHDAMIDLMVADPWVSQKFLAQHFGYSEPWISTVLSSDAFQAKLAARREEIVDPALKASLEERMRALVFRSLDVLQAKLALPTAMISDNVALRAAELGAKCLGMGGHAPQKEATPAADRLELMAARLIALQANVRKGNVYENVIEQEG